MQHEMMTSDPQFKSMVFVSGDHIVTTSLKVAEYFGKRHGNVLRAIKNLSCSAEFAKLNFELRFENNGLQNGKPQPLYEITKDGFFFLVMGFTGAKAATIKEAYINAFNWMAEQLAGRRHDLMRKHNSACLEYQMEKGVASLAGKTLNRWKGKKTILDDRISSIEHQMQLPLSLA